MICDVYKLLENIPDTGKIKNLTESEVHICKLFKLLTVLPSTDYGCLCNTRNMGIQQMQNGRGASRIKTFNDPLRKFNDVPYRG